MLGHCDPAFHAVVLHLIGWPGQREVPPEQRYRRGYLWIVSLFWC
jgi:hypothetical protein